MADRFTADKLAWIEQITRDAGLGHFAARVGVIIASHLNRETGEAFPGQERIASLTGASTRQVQRALKELAGRLHVAVEVRHGPNQSSRYRPLIWTENTTRVSSIQDVETRHPCRLSDGEKATNTVAKTRHPCRPNPLKEPTEVIRGAGGSQEAPPKGRLPDDFPSAEMIDLAQSKFEREGVAASARLCAEKFRSHYGASSCQDWSARWQTWALREIEYAARTGAKPGDQSRAARDQRAALEVLGRRGALPVGPSTDPIIIARRLRHFQDTGCWEAEWGERPTQTEVDAGMAAFVRRRLASLAEIAGANDGPSPDQSSLKERA